jgi:hypothetical protein
MGCPLGPLLARSPLPVRDWDDTDRKTEPAMLAEAWVLGALMLAGLGAAVLMLLR